MNRFAKDLVLQHVDGRFTELLSDLCGIDSASLDKQHHPCPNCGGENRFNADRDGLFEQVGLLHCNQKCEINGDALNAIMHFRNVQFSESLQLAGMWLVEKGLVTEERLAAPKPAAGGATVKATAKPGKARRKRSRMSDKAKKTRQAIEDSQVKWKNWLGHTIGRDESDKGRAKKREQELRLYAANKPGIDPESLIKSMARIYHKRPHGWCVVFTGTTSDKMLTGFQIVRVDGKLIQINEKVTEKSQNIKGTKDGWFCPSGNQAMNDADRVVKVEGPVDALAIQPLLPAGTVAITNLCGAGCWPEHDVAWLGDKTSIVVIHDADQPGQVGGVKFSQRGVKLGVEVKHVVLPFGIQPGHGKDLRDWVAAGGTQEQLETMVEETPAAVADSTQPAARHANDDSGDEARPAQVELTHSEKTVNSTVIAHLAEKADLYDFNGRLAEIRASHDDQNECKKVATPLVQATLREVIAESVHFYVEFETSEGLQREQKRTPNWCVDAVAARGQWPRIPILRRIVRCPVLRPDGTVLQTDGYDSVSKLYLDSHIEFRGVPEKPSLLQVTNAVDCLMDIVCDFPFVNDEHRAGWLASLLTPFARETYNGPTAPLFAVDASSAGSGKGLLTDITSIIVTGHVALKQSAPKNDEEFRKSITSKSLQSNPMEVIDNITGRFGCASFDAALTTPLWTDRLLKTNKTVEQPLRMAWYASGNNIQFVGDLPRRVCHIRLEPDVERPDETDSFKHGDVLGHVHSNRATFVAACLTILRGYFAAGRPDQSLPAWGSYEGWSSVVRNAIVWAGLPDPGLTRKNVREEDGDLGSLQELIRTHEQVDPGRKGLRAADMVRIAKRGKIGIPDEYIEQYRDAVEEFTQTNIERIDNRLSYRLRHYRRKVVDGKQLDTKLYNGSNRWIVCDVGNTRAEAEIEKGWTSDGNGGHVVDIKTGMSTSSEPVKDRELF